MRLEQELANPEKNIKLRALKYIQKLGHSASELIGNVKPLLKDKNAYIRSQAAATIYRITGTTIVGYKEICAALLLEKHDSVKEMLSFIVAEKLDENFNSPAIHSLAKKITLLETLTPGCKIHLCKAYRCIEKPYANEFVSKCAESKIKALQISLPLVEEDEKKKEKPKLDRILS